MARSPAGGRRASAGPAWRSRSGGGLVALLTAACTHPGGLASGQGPDGADTGADTGSAESGGLTVSGRVVGLDETPVTDLFVTVSSEYCVPDRTDEDGAFAVTEVAPGSKRLITYGETATNGLFASLVVAFQADADLRFDPPLHTPALTERIPLDPDAVDAQVITTAEGVELTIEAGALRLAPFAPAELQVATVPIDLAPALTPAGVELVELVVLHPIQSTLDPPGALRLPADAGLLPGTAVTFLALDYDTGTLVPVASGTVDDDGHPVTDPGEGIPELTWIGLAIDDKPKERR